SDRTKLLMAIVDNFENRIFLTATPHNGYTESFTALLELLDPLRFSRGPILDKTQLQTVMVRRLKKEIGLILLSGYSVIFFISSNVGALSSAYLFTLGSPLVIFFHGIN